MPLRPFLQSAHSLSRHDCGRRLTTCSDCTCSSSTAESDRSVLGNHASWKADGVIDIRGNLGDQIVEYVVCITSSHDRGLDGSRGRISRARRDVTNMSPGACKSVLR